MTDAHLPDEKHVWFHSTPKAIADWQARRDYYGATAADWLARWDAGDICWTIEMGGLGPGYEQAIQVLVAEIIRDNIGKVIPGYGEKFSDWADDTVRRIDAKDPETGKFAMGGFSGAQVGAAKNLAWHFLTEGPGQILINCKRHDMEDRKTMVSNFWPRVAKQKAVAA